MTLYHFKQVVPLLAGLALGGASFFAQAQDYTVRIPVAAASHTPSTQTIDFGNVVLNKTATRALVFINRGAADTTISAVSTAGRPVVLSENTCSPGKVLRTHETCSVVVTVKPMSLGAWDSAVTVAHSALLTPDIFSLKAYGVTTTSSLEVTPSNASFGKQPMQTWSEPMALTVKNTGEETAFIEKVALADNLIHFKLEAAECETALAPNQACTLYASFGPKYLGTTNTRVVMTLEDGTNLHAASLTGVGVQGLPSFDASTFTFIGALVGQTTAKPLTLTNVGSGPLLINSLVVSGDASIALASTTCGEVLASAESCTVTLSVTPEDMDIRTGLLTLSASGTTNRITRVQVFSQPAVSSSVIELSPSLVAFPATAVGQAAEQTMVLRSTGNLAAVVNSYALTGPNASEFALVNANACVGTLAPGMQCELVLRATPQGGAVRQAQLAINANTSSPVSAVPLRISGLQGLVVANPSALTFSATEVGQSRSTTLVLSNSGAAPLTLSAAKGSTALKGTVTVSGCIGTTLAAGGNCTMTVRFAPTDVGALSGALELLNTGAQSPLTVPVAATGVAAPVAQATLDTFVCTPAVAQTGTAVSCTAALRSTGTAALTVASVVRTSTQFAVPTHNCPASVAPGSACTITLTSSSATAGTFSTTVSATTNAGVKSASAQATVQAPSASLVPTSHGVVQVGQSSVRTHQLNNTGAFPVQVTLPATLSASAGLTLGGVPSSGSACVNGQSLAAGASCVLTTTCTPATAAALAPTLSVGTSAGPVSASVTCQGEFPPPTGAALFVSPNPADLGNLQVNSSGSRVVTLRNDAPTTVTISALALAGTHSSEFTLTANGCLKSLAPSASCTVTVNAPKAVLGLRQGSLNITANTATAVPSVAVRATGVQGALSVTPTSAAYGAVTVGSTKSQSFTVSNSGTAVLNVSSVTVGGADDSRFTVATNTCSTLAVGATCTVSVAYAPESAVNAAASLKVSSSNASNGSASVALSGSGTPAPAPAGVVTPGADCSASVQFGGTPTCSVTVSSTGNAPLVLRGYSLTRTSGDFSATRPVSTVTNAGAFAAVSGSPSYNSTTGEMTLPVGSSVRFTQSLAPTTATTASAVTYRTAGTHANQLSFVLASGSLSAATMTYSVQAPIIEATVSPAALSLMPAQKGTHRVTVTNKGSGPVKFATATTGTSAPATATTVSGTAGWVTVSTTGSCVSTTTLASGQSCTVDAVCSPSIAGATSSARLTVNTAVPFGASNNSLFSQSLNVTCTGVGATAVITPAVPGLTAVVATGSQSGNWLRFTNTSPVPLSIVDLVEETAFLLFTDTANPAHCNKGKVVAPGDSCDFLEIVAKTHAVQNSSTPLVLTATANRVETDRGAFTFNSNYTITGLEVLALSDVGTAIQRGETREVNFRVTNLTPSTISEISLVSLTGEGTTLKDNTCTSLAPDASCTVTVVWAPPLTALGQTTGLYLTANGRFERILNGTKYVATTSSTGGSWGRSVPLTSPVAKLTAGTHASTMVSYASQAGHVLTNIGNGPVTVSTPTVKGSGLSLLSHNCPASLDAAQSCTIVTQHVPVSAAAYSGELSVPTSAGTKIVAIPLSSVPQVSVTENCPKVIPLGSAGNCTFTLRNDSDKAASAAITAGYTQSLCTYGPYYSCSSSSIRPFFYTWGVMGNPSCTTGVSPGAISGFGALTHNCPFNLEPGQSCTVTMPYQANRLVSCLQSTAYRSPVTLSGAMNPPTPSTSAWFSIGGPGISHSMLLGDIKAYAFAISAGAATHPKVPFGGANTVDIPVRVTSPITVDNVQLNVARQYEGVRTGAPATTAKATDIVTVESTTCTGTLSKDSTCVIRTRCTGSTPGGYRISLNLSGDVQNGTATTTHSGTGVTSYCEVDYPASTAADLVFSATSATGGSRTVGTFGAFSGTVRNNSGWPIPLTDANFTGPNAPLFSLFSSCTKVPAFGVCSFSLRYTPTSIGTHSATFNVYSGLSATPIQLQVTGTGR